MTHRRFNRREFLGAITAGVGVLACDATTPETQDLDDSTIRARPGTPTLGLSTGWQPLGLGEGRDGQIYAPPSYDPNIPAPLAVLLHGAGSSSNSWVNGSASQLADANGVVLLCPDSRNTTWDVIQRGLFGADVEFIDEALALTFNLCNVNPSRICLGGFSDGAGYALSVGVANGDLFTHLMGFSPGFFAPLGRRGKPRVFLSHGTGDPVLPWGFTAGTVRPQLQQEGYEVEFFSFPSGHTVPDVVGVRAFEWFGEG